MLRKKHKLNFISEKLLLYYILSITLHSMSTQEDRNTLMGDHGCCPPPLTHVSLEGPTNNEKFAVYLHQDFSKYSSHA